MDTNQNNIGDDNVVIGNRNINGNRNVIIDATDSNGNILLNRPMVVGYNAKGGPNDVVIGANAGCGSDIFLLLDQLKELIGNKSDSEIIEKISTLVSELKNSNKDVAKISGIWNSIINAVKTIGENVAIGLIVNKISSIII